VKFGGPFFSHRGPGAGAADDGANSNHEDTVAEAAYKAMPGVLEAVRMLAENRR
jgi:hypothetical protein